MLNEATFHYTQPLVFVEHSLTKLRKFSSHSCLGALSSDLKLAKIVRIAARSLVLARHNIVTRYYAIPGLHYAMSNWALDLSA